MESLENKVEARHLRLAYAREKPASGGKKKRGRKPDTRRGQDEKWATSGTQKQKNSAARKKKELADTRKGNDSEIYCVPGKNAQAEGVV